MIEFTVYTTESELRLTHFPTPTKYDWIRRNSISSFLWICIAKIGCTCHPVLQIIFLYMDIINEDSPSEYTVKNPGF